MVEIYYLNLFQAWGNVAPRSNFTHCDEQWDGMERRSFSWVPRAGLQPKSLYSGGNMGHLAPSSRRFINDEFVALEFTMTFQEALTPDLIHDLSLWCWLSFLDCLEMKSTSGVYFALPSVSVCLHVCLSLARALPLSETGSHSGLRLEALLRLQPPKCWEARSQHYLLLILIWYHVKFSSKQKDSLYPTYFIFCLWE